MTVPSAHALSVVFLVWSCVALAMALELGFGVIQSTICVLLSAQLYATEVKRDQKPPKGGDLIGNES